MRGRSCGRTLEYSNHSPCATRLLMKVLNETFYSEPKKKLLFTFYGSSQRPPVRTHRRSAFVITHNYRATALKSKEYANCTGRSGPSRAAIAMEEFLMHVLTACTTRQPHSISYLSQSDVGTSASELTSALSNADTDANAISKSMRKLRYYRCGCECPQRPYKEPLYFRHS
ncbi:hypothetical protein EVAR_78631_1 [Eumeta japonica]|uniref:Uncharacterized protein n=1 Tax=Eumeta variegata TaxID=151549 RepID=A0A4C1U7U0_EUMVA|nr:hypothetical protein EVAR_78631_1 [Eumeta japonica]